MYIIVGNYINDEIKAQRGLPAPNPAASARMLHLAKAIKSQKDSDSIILSSSSAASIKFSRQLVYPETEHVIDHVRIYCASALAIPFFSMIWEFFSLLLLFHKIKKKCTIKAVLIYCYYPSSVLIAIFAKLYQLKIIEDLEDVVNPNWNDWKDFRLLDGLRQLFGGFLMKIMLIFSDTIIIPTKQFQNAVPAHKNILEISGCIDITNDFKENVIENDKINVLMSGLLTNEQGLGVFFETLTKFNELNNNTNLQFHITGYGGNSVKIEDAIEKFPNLEVCYHGFLSYRNYLQLLKKSNVCLVLQDPEGVYGKTKTPSKGFEYMSYGKLVIVSNVGDFQSLPEKTVMPLHEYNSTSLLKLILNITQQDTIDYGNNARKYAIENWSYENVGNKILKSLEK